MESGGLSVSDFNERDRGALLRGGGSVSDGGQHSRGVRCVGVIASARFHFEVPQ
jgi:hypothetical protein